MPIRFNINPIDGTWTLPSALVLYVFAWVEWLHTVSLTQSQRSIFRFRMPNVTSVIVDLYINIPYEDCRCSIIPIEYCLKDERLKYTRTMPLILFVLIVYFIWNHLSFSGNRAYFFIKIFWILSLFIFFGSLVIVYRSSYYYQLLSTILYGTGHLLFFSVLFKMRLDNPRYHS